MSKPLRIARGMLTLAVLGGLAALAWKTLQVKEPAQPENPSLIRTHAAFEQGNPEEALRWVEDALKLQPDNDQAKALRHDLRVRTRADEISPTNANAGTSLSAAPRFGADEDVLPSDPKARARAHLVAGRPELAKADLDGDASKADPEASWLLSRAALQLGDLPGAFAAWEHAKGFAKDDPMTREPAPFAGEASCASCHADIHRRQRSSRHAKTLRSGDDLATVGWPKGPQPDAGVAGFTHTFERDGDRITLETTLPGNAAASRRYDIEYAIGSGHRSVSFIARLPDGSFSVPRISLFHGDSIVGLTPSAATSPTFLPDYFGRALPAEQLRGCLGCHTTALRASADRTTLVTTDRGIGCERCHGPGQNHIKAIALEFPDLAIARPKSASAEQVVALCGECHSPSPGHPISPDDPIYVRMQAITLPLSRCYTESPGKLSCVACHDPHSNVETSAQSYEARCLACHASSQPERPGTRAAKTECPISPAKDCLGCHMPKQEIASEKASFSDHHIRVHASKKRP
ncbi:multiheme c-type cytochrome [Isosphaeraceae bacterium EP7]